MGRACPAPSPAIAHLVLRVTPREGTGPVVIHSDSKYAMDVTQGTKRAHSNVELVETTQKYLDKVKVRVGGGGVGD